MWPIGSANGRSAAYTQVFMSILKSRARLRFPLAKLAKSFRFKHLVIAFDLKMIFPFCFQHRHPYETLSTLIFLYFLFRMKTMSAYSNHCILVYMLPNLSSKTMFLHSKYGMFLPKMEFSRLQNFACYIEK